MENNMVGKGDNMKKILIILLVILVGLNGYLIYQLYFNNEEDVVKEEELEKEEEEIIESVVKIDATKNIVHDADYDVSGIKTSYSNGVYTYYLKDIKAPFININNNTVKAINDETKEIFEEVLAWYELGANEGMGEYVDVCEYEYKVFDNILSVMYTYGLGHTDVVHPQYFTYNIDLNTNEILTYEEVYTKLGYNANSINSTVEQVITTYMEDWLKELAGDYPEGTDFDTYNDESINNYKESVENNTIKYFIDKNNKLNIIVKLMIPAGIGYFDTLLIVE